MQKTAIILSAAALLVIILNFLAGGFDQVEEGFLASLNTLLRALPIILAAFFLTGQLRALLSTESINRLLQKISGIKGVVLSCIAGGLLPGGPYVYYPFIYNFKEKGIPFHLFFSFIVGKQVYDVARLPLEISLINPGIALLRNLITLPLPILLGLLSRFFFRGSTFEFFEKEEK